MVEAAAQALVVARAAVAQATVIAMVIAVTTRVVASVLPSLSESSLAAAASVYLSTAWSRTAWRSARKLVRRHEGRPAVTRSTTVAITLTVMHQGNLLSSIVMQLGTQMMKLTQECRWYRLLISKSKVSTMTKRIGNVTVHLSKNLYLKNIVL